MRDDARVRVESIRRAAVLAGDEAAWRAWYDEAYQPLRVYVFWRLGRQSAGVDEVVQETWLVAVRKIRQFDPQQGTFLDWLRGIAANVMRNHLRQPTPSSLAMEPAVDGLVWVAALALDVEEQSVRVAEALSALPDQYAAVLAAKYLEQRSVKEIAEAWNQTAKAIESLLTRARTAFREVYGQEC